MRHDILKTLAISALLGIGAVGVAHADCESDLIQLENAYKTPNLSVAGKAALDEAKTKAVAAMKKDDDKTCHDAIATALPKAGLKMK